MQDRVLTNRKRRDECDTGAVAHIRRHWAVFFGLVVALAVWCAADVSRRARVDPLHPGWHMTDVTVYTEAGRAFFDGREPYEVANIRGWKYLYPPLFALLISPLAALSPPWQATVWFAASALMCFGTYFECRRLIDWCRSPLTAGDSSSRAAPADRFLAIPNRLWGAAATSAVFPALNCLQRGQMGMALVYFLLLGFRLIVTGQTPAAWAAGGVMLSLPIALKLTPLLPAGCVLFVLLVAAGSVLKKGDRHLATGNFFEVFDCRSEPVPLFQRPASAGASLVRSGSRLSRPVWSSAGCLAGGIFFLLLLPASLVGWSANLRHLATWYEKVATRVNDVRSDDFGGDVDSPRNQSLSNGVYRFGNWVAYQFAGGPYDQFTGKAHAAMPMDAPAISHTLLAVRGLALVALLAVAIRAGRSGNRRLWGAAFGLAAVATLVVSPVARGHYFVLLLPAALFVPMWLIELGKFRAAWHAALVPALLVAAHYTLLDYAGRIGVLGIGTTLWYFGACTGIVLGREHRDSAENQTQIKPLPARAA